MRSRTLLLLPLLFLLGGASPAEENLQGQTAARQEELREAEADLRRLQEEIARIRQRGQGVARDIALVQANLRLAQTKVRRESARLRVSESKLKSLTRQITDTELKLRELTRSLVQRARALFRVSRGAGLEVLLSAEDAADLAIRTRFLEALTQENKTLVARTRGERTRLRAAKASAEEERAERRKAVADLETAKREVERRRRELLARQGEINRQLELARRKERQVRQLIESIERAIRQAQTRPSTDRRPPPEGPAPGAWRRPVSGPRYDPGIRGLPGVFIECPKGTSVRAAAAGSVVSVESFRGLGVTVVMGHGGGYSTAYGNLTSASVRAGERVAAGAALGASGESPYGPMLFFALYKDGRPVPNTARELGL